MNFIKNKELQDWIQIYSFWMKGNKNTNQIHHELIQIIIQNFVHLQMGILSFFFVDETDG